MNREYASDLTVPFTSEKVMWRQRPETAVQALMETAPHRTPETSKEELLHLREIVQDAIDLLEPGERILFDATVVERRSLRNFGLPKTTVARRRDKAIRQLRLQLVGAADITDHYGITDNNRLDWIMNAFTGSTVFLAGPMRGYPAFNFPAFEAARTALREHGVIVLCPAERDTENGFNADNLSGTEQELKDNGFNVTKAVAANKRFIDQADAVVVLPGWENSEGAREEMRHAFQQKIPVFTLGVDGLPEAKVTRLTTQSSAVWEVRPL